MSVLVLLINGEPAADADHAVAAEDRGLHYGDGLFETALLRDGRVRLLEDHMARLGSGCARLGIPLDEDAVLTDIEHVCAGRTEGVVKVLVSRGAGHRGYRPPERARPTRWVALYPSPQPAAREAMNVRWCDMRLGRNTRLAGIKHINRLEQVLAQAEWNDPETDEGLMLDTEDEVVSATSSNVFVVRDGVLITPDLRYCGVRGVMRNCVLRVAAEMGLALSEEAVRRPDVDGASEVFLTNAVRGLRPVAALGEVRWTQWPVTRRLQAAVERACAG